MAAGGLCRANNLSSIVPAVDRTGLCALRRGLVVHLSTRGFDSTTLVHWYRSA